MARRNGYGLGAQPGEVGAQPGEVGAQPGELGAQPGEVGAQPGEVGAQPGELGAQPGEVGAQPGEVGAQSGELGAQPGEVGGQSGELGAQPGEVGGQSGELGAQPGELGGTRGSLDGRITAKRRPLTHCVIKGGEHRPQSQVNPASVLLDVPLAAVVRVRVLYILIKLLRWQFATVRNVLVGLVEDADLVEESGQGETRDIVAVLESIAPKGADYRAVDLRVLYLITQLVDVEASASTGRLVLSKEALPGDVKEQIGRLPQLE